MKNLTQSITSIAATVVLFCVGGVMAGIGLAVVATLAVFALALAGLTILAAPFVGVVQDRAADAAPSA